VAPRFVCWNLRSTHTDTQTDERADPDTDGSSGLLVRSRGLGNCVGLVARPGLERCRAAVAKSLSSGKMTSPRMAAQAQISKRRAAAPARWSIPDRPSRARWGGLSVIIPSRIAVLQAARNRVTDVHRR